MARLIILLGPVASALGGIAIGFAVDHLFFNAVFAVGGAGLELAGIKVGDEDEEDKKKSAEEVAAELEAKRANGGAESFTEIVSQARKPIMKVWNHPSLSLFALN
jgi:hypothetical protein